MYELSVTPDDFVPSDPESESSDQHTEYDNEELLILNTPDVLYRLFSTTNYKSGSAHQSGGNFYVRTAHSGVRQAYIRVSTYGFPVSLFHSAIIAVVANAIRWQ